MSKSTLVLSLLVIFLLIGVISLIPAPIPLPAPYTPTAPAQGTAVAAATEAEPAPATALPEASPTPGASSTPAPQATRYVEPTEPPLLPSPTPTALPQLIVPGLDLEQAIVPVPIRDGMWDLSDLGPQVGWLTTTGQHPEGDLAPALVAHVNIALGQPGPFVNLKDLGLQEPVIYRAGGIDYIYAIQSTERVEPEAVDALYVPDGRRLLLVTCSDWSYFWRQYARRLIVTAQLVRTEPSP
jgi:LPXTG-site transpeptidase (sortase) family protein